MNDRFASLEQATEAAAEFAADEINKYIQGRIKRNATICMRKLGEFVGAETKFPIETPWGAAASLTGLMHILVRRQAEIVCDICSDVDDVEVEIGQIERELFAQIDRGEEPSLAVLKENRNGVSVCVGIFPQPAVQ